jgi:hypothetical protein
LGAQTQSMAASDTIFNLVNSYQFHARLMAVGMISDIIQSLMS